MAGTGQDELSSFGACFCIKEWGQLPGGATGEKEEVARVSRSSQIPCPRGMEAQVSPKLSLPPLSASLGSLTESSRLTQFPPFSPGKNNDNHKITMAPVSWSLALSFCKEDLNEFLQQPLWVATAGSPNLQVRKPRHRAENLAPGLTVPTAAGESRAGGQGHRLGARKELSWPLLAVSTLLLLTRRRDNNGTRLPGLLKTLKESIRVKSLAHQGLLNAFDSPLKY